MFTISSCKVFQKDQPVYQD